MKYEMRDERERDSDRAHRQLIPNIGISLARDVLTIYSNGLTAALIFKGTLAIFKGTLAIPLQDLLMKEQDSRNDTLESIRNLLLEVTTDCFDLQHLNR